MTPVQAFAVLSVWLCCATAWGQTLCGSSRLPADTLALPDSPPRHDYQTEPAFGGLSFNSPTTLGVPPGETNRLFIAEQGGRILVITNLAAPSTSVFLDISDRVVGSTWPDPRGLLAFTFHPGFATNGYFYVFYTLTTNTALGSGLHDRLSRFQVSSTNRNQALASSEFPLITQFDQAPDHNGADLHFGPDGYLYVSLGDEGGPNDFFNTGQTISKDFFGGILRLDVDNRPGNLHPNPYPASSGAYSIPSDSPFVGITIFQGIPIDPSSVRTEFYAIGFQNPQRFCFDPLTGGLYCADQGQSSRQEVDLVVPGGNYGWPFFEGTQPGPKASQAPGGVTFIPPALEYPYGNGTNAGRSIIGGIVYQGTRLAQLYGAYVFGDAESGNLWSTRLSGTNPPEMELLAVENPGLAGFGCDPLNGDVLFVNQSDGTLKRLVYGTNLTGQPFPQTLSATGAFADVTTFQPSVGVVPYQVNLPSWTDGAVKTRWFALSSTNLAFTFTPSANWLSPTGTVWIQHFELPSGRRLETRFLVRTANGAYGVSYRWTPGFADATLVPEEGADELVVSSTNGASSSLPWHYASRAECLVCHTAKAGYALGFNAAQLNLDLDCQGGSVNQIAALNRLGYFNSNVQGMNTLRVIPSLTNGLWSVESRVRGYLAANCGGCHQPDLATSSNAGTWDARLSTPLSATHLIGEIPQHSSDPTARLVLPGFSQRSILLSRLTTLGPGHMPPLGSVQPDTQAIQLLTQWIDQSLVGYQTFADWQLAFFSSTNAPLATPGADPDGDGVPNYLEYLAGGNPLLASDGWNVSYHLADNTFHVDFPVPANRGFQVQYTSTPWDSASWLPLDVPDNRPILFASPRRLSVADTMSKAGRVFYRVPLFEP
jgi:glucose/arabinose dehydrogenase